MALVLCRPMQARIQTVSTGCSTALLFMSLQRLCLNCCNAVNDSSRLLKFCYMCTGSQFFITLVRAFLSVLLTHWERARLIRLLISASSALRCSSTYTVTKFLICAGTYATSGWQARWVSANTIHLLYVTICRYFWRCSAYCCWHKTHMLTHTRFYIL